MHQGEIAMNKIFSSVAAIVMAGTVGSVEAADMSRPLPPPMPYVFPVYNWSGFYVGGNLGGGWAGTTLTDNLTSAQVGVNPAGVVGGGQLGFNYQVGNFVFGAEWMFDGTSLNSSRNSAALGGSAATDWLTTLAGRFGWAADNWLFYGKAGGGWAANPATLTNTVTGLQFSGSSISPGWLLGGGIEYGITRNWTAKIEYDYLGLESWSTNGLTVRPNVQMLLAGFNFRF
jgi:outer membrane immunogenic protein